MKTPVSLGVWRPGWWREHIAPDLNPQQIVEHLEREAPEHPALGKIRACLRGWLKASGRREMFRCHLCRDSKWVALRDVVTVDGNRAADGARRCTGTHGRCLQDEWEQARVRELKAQAAVNAESGEGATL